MAKEPTPYVRKKIRKPRKPMTPEQKAAATERLAKAREKRMRENPPQYKNIHPDVLALDSEHPLHMTKVKQWIKTQKEIASEERKNERAGVKGAAVKRIRAETYARSMQRYLEDSVWTDGYYGEYGEHQMHQICTTMAYYPDGTPKRTYGVFYPDIGYIWGYPEDRGGMPSGLAKPLTAESMAVKTQSNDLENFFE
jgi:hypothetical protein